MPSIRKNGKRVKFRRSMTVSGWRNRDVEKVPKYANVVAGHKRKPKSRLRHLTALWRDG